MCCILIVVCVFEMCCWMLVYVVVVDVVFLFGCEGY